MVEGVGRLTYLVLLKRPRFNALSDIYQGKNSKSLTTTLHRATERADAHLNTQIFYVAKDYLQRLFLQSWKSD